MSNTSKLMLFFLAVTLSILACDAEDTAPTPRPTPTTDPNALPRSFHLGFTPFPFDSSLEAVNFTYDRLAIDSDIVAHHFDDGIPWLEALSDDPYSKYLQGDWEARKEKTPSGHKVFIAITPIRQMRDGLALYWGDAGSQPLPPPWDTYDFNHPDVKSAYLNHLLRAVEYFEPDYLAIGIEVNLLLDSVPEQWDTYMELHTFIYTELKGRYPDLPIFASVSGNALLEGYRDIDNTPANLQAFQELLPYTDYYAISLYPFLGAKFLEGIPDDMFEKLLSLSDKPIAFAETGYPAETLSLYNGAVTWESDPQKQLDYFSMLLEEADKRDFVFIINFVLRDYDRLWEKFDDPEMVNLARIWRDTGFYDQDGYPRPVLDLWREMLARPVGD